MNDDVWKLCTLHLILSGWWHVPCGTCWQDVRVLAASALWQPRLCQRALTCTDQRVQPVCTMRVYARQSQLDSGLNSCWALQDYGKGQQMTLWAFGSSLAGGSLVALNGNPFSPDVKVQPHTAAATVPQACSNLDHPIASQCLPRSMLCHCLASACPVKLSDLRCHITLALESNVFICTWTGYSGAGMAGRAIL